MGYYGFLATRVTPGRLLASAARRAVRGALNRLAPPLSPPRDRLLAMLGCESGYALARLLARPRSARPPWTPDGLRRALGRHLPGEAERAIARAEDAAAGRLVVYGRTVEVARPGGTDWQLDALHGGRFAGWAPSAALPPAPGLDPKLAWAIGRGDHWVALACGAVLDRVRGDALADSLAASIRDFCASNPVGLGVHWTSAMEASLRAFNLVLALWILSLRRAPLDPDLAVEAARLFVSTGRFVLAHLEDGAAVPNNHLVSNWLGLLACAEGLPEWPEAARWRALALAGLRDAIVEQVHPDGTTFEGSVPYHRFGLEMFTAGAVLAHASGRGLGARYAARLRGMFGAVRALLSASGELPNLGDNDSGHVLHLVSRGPAEGRYLLSLGAALFRDRRLLVAPGAPDGAEVAWLLGPRGLEWLARARPGPPPGSAAFRDGGFHVVRRGAIEAFVSCGANGQRGIGGHSHNDKLSFELRVAGALAVCDPGCPAYTSDPEVRNAFRATRAHATVVVDGLEQAPLPADRIFALPEAARAQLVSLDAEPAADRLVGEHHGYARVGVVHRREIFAAERGLVVVDRLLGRGTHAIELRWPLAAAAPRARRASPDEVAALEALGRVARLRRPADPAHAIEVPLGGGAGRLVIAFAAPAALVPELGPALRSPGYGEVVEGSAILLAGPVACPTTFATLFLHLPDERSTTP